MKPGTSIVERFFIMIPKALNTGFLEFLWPEKQRSFKAKRPDGNQIPEVSAACHVAPERRVYIRLVEGSELRLCQWINNYIRSGMRRW